MALEEYKLKRDFKKTAEPAGKPLPKKVKGASRFVIQKHVARRLHYDSVWRWKACLNRGRCQKDFRGSEAKNISPWKWKIIRSNTRTSKALFRRGNMAAAQ